MAKRSVGIEIFYWIERWSDDQAAWFGRARTCGFDCVEASLIDGPETDVDAMRTAAERLGLDLYCAMGLPREMDISSPHAATRRAGIEHLKRCVDTAARAGSPILGGVLYAPWLHFPEATDLQPYRERSAAALREVAIAADNAGVTLTLEPLNRFETFMFNTVAQGLDFLAMVDHLAVKLQLDVYHMNMEEDDIAAAIRLTGDKLGHFHCAASNRKLPGRGHIDWDGIKAALDDIHYAGPLIIETFPNPRAETGRTVHTWRPLVQDYDRDAQAALDFIRQRVA